MSKRPSGILTDTDREYLEADYEYYTGDNARQNRYQRRRDIRERITQSLLDFQDIKIYLDENLRTHIFSNPETSGAHSKTEFHQAIESLIYWLYTGFREQGIDFTDRIKDPIELAERDYQTKQTGKFVDVTYESEVRVKETDAINEFVRAIESGNPVPAEVVFQVPNLPELSIDTENIETVRVTPNEDTRNPSVDKILFSQIIQGYIDDDLTVEIIDGESRE